MKFPPRAAYRYAKALLALARESAVEPRILEDLSFIQRAMEQSTALSAFIGNRLLPKATRQQAIQALFKDRVHSLTWKCIMVMETKRRLDLLPAVCTVFKTLSETERGIVRGEMAAISIPPAEAVSAMAGNFGSLLGRTVLLQPRENPALIGGCRVQVGDLVYDFSLAARLRMARQALTRV